MKNSIKLIMLALSSTSTGSLFCMENNPPEFPRPDLTTFALMMPMHHLPAVPQQEQAYRAAKQAGSQALSTLVHNNLIHRQASGLPHPAGELFPENEAHD